MKGVEFTTSTGRMNMIAGVLLLISTIAIALGHATFKEVLQAMVVVLLTLALVMFTRVE